MPSKGGAPPGEAHGRSKLTNKSVLEIRERYQAGGVTYLDLSVDYDVSIGTVSAVLSRRTWRHI